MEGLYPTGGGTAMLERGNQARANGAGQWPATAPAAAPRGGTIPELLAEQQSELAELHGALGELELRLSLLLGAPSQLATTDPAGKAMGSPQVSDRTRAHTRVIRAARTRVTDLLQRLEV